MCIGGQRRQDTEVTPILQVLHVANERMDVATCLSFHLGKCQMNSFFSGFGFHDTNQTGIGHSFSDCSDHQIFIIGFESDFNLMSTAFSWRQLELLHIQVEAQAFLCGSVDPVVAAAVGWNQDLLLGLGMYIRAQHQQKIREGHITVNGVRAESGWSQKSHRITLAYNGLDSCNIVDSALPKFAAPWTAWHFGAQLPTCDRTMARSLPWLSTFGREGSEFYERQSATQLL